MHDKKDYCSLTPEFPKKAFMLFLFILQEDNVLGSVPMESIYTTPKNAAYGVGQAMSHFNSLDKTITVPEECLLIPLSLNSLYPLKKGFWKKPEIKYDSQIRMKTFTKVLEYPEFFSLLVTPFSYEQDSNKWYLNATIPLPATNNSSIIEQFMLKSDQVVESKAKYAAIYNIEGKLRFNWQTNEMKRFDDSARRVLQIVN